MGHVGDPAPAPRPPQRMDLSRQELAGMPDEVDRQSLVGPEGRPARWSEGPEGEHSDIDGEVDGHRTGHGNQSG